MKKSPPMKVVIYKGKLDIKVYITAANCEWYSIRLKRGSMYGLKLSNTCVCKRIMLMPINT
jgi:hypothetical protein